MSRISRNIESGSLLVSQPFMMDTNFKRSVILITDHDDEDGSVGFVLNKRIHMSINELIGDFPEFEATVYYGGPVATDTIHYIHDCGDILEESVEIKPGLYWGGNFDKLKFLVRNKLIQPINIRFYIGYSGWSTGQLYDELDFGSWLTAEFDLNYIFNKNEISLWSQVLHNKGNTYTVLAQIPEFVSLN